MLTSSSWSPQRLLAWTVVPALAALAVTVAGDWLDGDAELLGRTVLRLALGVVAAGLLLHRATGEARAARLSTAAALVAVAGWSTADQPALGAAAMAVAGHYAMQVSSGPPVDTSLRLHRELLRSTALLAVVAAALVGIDHLLAPDLAHLLGRGAASALWAAAAVGLVRRWRRGAASQLQALVSGLALTVALGEAAQALAVATGQSLLATIGIAAVLAGLLVALVGVVVLLGASLEERRSQLHLLRVEQARADREREEQRREFVHEARNALLGLEAVIWTLRRAPVLSDALREELTVALTTSVNRLKAMILPEEHDEVPATIAADVVVPTVLVARSRGAEIVLDGDLQAAVRCGPGVFTQVLDNLLINAQRHGRAEKAPATVHLQQDDTRLLMRVSDQGPGVPEERWEQVFLPGVRFGSGGGDGLGLAVSRDLLRWCGGDLWIEPSPHGTTFVAALPLAADHTPDQAPDPASDQAPDPASDQAPDPASDQAPDPASEQVVGPADEGGDQLV